MNKIGIVLASALALSAVGCADDGTSDSDDAGVTGDGGTTTGDEDAGTTGDEDGGTTGDEDGGTTGDEDGGTTGEPSYAAITEVGSFDFTEANDLSAVAYAADGKIYAAGYDDADDDDATETDQSLAVMRFNADGTLDTSFNDDGVVVHDLATDLPDAGRAMVELADGNVVIGANVADGNGGQDVVLVKLDDNGELVTGFGDNGVLTVTFGWPEGDDANWPDAGSAPSDAVYDVEIDDSGSEEKLVVMGYGSAPYDAGAGTQRTDDDRYVVRLMADDGAFDSGFNGGEVFSWDNGGGYEDDTRRGIVESDGTIVSSGYAHFPTEDGENHVMLLRLNPDGTLDTSFGFGFDDSPNGATAFNPFEDDGGMAEAYGVVKLTDGSYVTTGYGYATELTTGTSSMGYVTSQAQDLVAFGVTADGTGLSTDFGKNDSGAWAYQSEEFSLDTFEDRGRALVALPDDRVVHVGRFGGIAAIFVTLPDGSLDEAQGDDGLFLFEDDTVGQQFFDVALSADGSRIATTTRGFDAAGVRLAILEVADE